MARCLLVFFVLSLRPNNLPVTDDQNSTVLLSVVCVCECVCRVGLHSLKGSPRLRVLCCFSVKKCKEMITIMCPKHPSYIFHIHMSSNAPLARVENANPYFAYEFFPHSYGALHWPLRHCIMALERCRKKVIPKVRGFISVRWFHRMSNNAVMNV